MLIHAQKENDPAFLRHWSVLVCAMKHPAPNCHFVSVDAGSIEQRDTAPFRASNTRQCAKYIGNSSSGNLFALHTACKAHTQPLLFCRERDGIRLVTFSGIPFPCPMADGLPPPTPQPSNAYPPSLLWYWWVHALFAGEAYFKRRNSLRSGNAGGMV